MRTIITQLSTTPTGSGWYACYANPEWPSKPHYLPLACWRTTAPAEVQDEAFKADGRLCVGAGHKTVSIVGGSAGIEDLDRSSGYGDYGFIHYGSVGFVRRDPKRVPTTTTSERGISAFDRLNGLMHLLHYSEEAASRTVR